MVKNLPAVQERWVWSLVGEDPLEKGMGTHSSTLAWRIPWTEEPGGLQFLESCRVRHDWAANNFTLPQRGKKIILFWCKITISGTSSIFTLSIYTSVATVMQKKLLPFITQLNTHLAKNLENWKRSSGWTPDCHLTPMRWTDQWWHVWDAVAFDVTAWPSQCKSIWLLLQFNLKSHTQCLLWSIWTKNM